MAAVKNVLRNPDLLQVLLAGIGVIGVYNDSRIFQSSLVIQRFQAPQGLIMIIRHAAAELIDIAAENRMRHGVSGGLHFPAPVQKALPALRRLNGVHHHRQIPGRRVFHACRNPDSACHQPVQLVLYRACPDRNIGQQVGQVPVILRVQHLLRTGKTGFFDHPCVQLPDSDNPGLHVLSFFRIRLMDHSFISFSDRSGFIGIDTRNNENPVLYLFLHPRQTVHILQYRILVIRGTRTNKKKKLIAFSGKNIFYFPVSFFLQRFDLRRKRKFFLQLRRGGNFTEKLHLHFHIL